jgi:hypothetical protein
MASSQNGGVTQPTRVQGRRDGVAALIHAVVAAFVNGETETEQVARTEHILARWFGRKDEPTNGGRG